MKYFLGLFTVLIACNGKEATTDTQCTETTNLYYESTDTSDPHSTDEIAIPSDAEDIVCCYDTYDQTIEQDVTFCEPYDTVKYYEGYIEVICDPHMEQTYVRFTTCE